MTYEFVVEMKGIFAELLARPFTPGDIEVRVVSVRQVEEAPEASQAAAGGPQGDDRPVGGPQAAPAIALPVAPLAGRTPAAAKARRRPSFRVGQPVPGPVQPQAPRGQYRDKVNGTPAQPTAPVAPVQPAEDFDPF